MNYNLAIAMTKEERPIKQILMYHTGMKAGRKRKAQRDIARQYINASNKTLTRHWNYNKKKRDF